VAYSTTSDVQKAFNANRVTSLADDDADGTADTNVISQLIDDADAYIYSHIRHLHTNLAPDDLTAGSDVPNDLRWASTHRTVILLKRRQGLNVRDDQEELERWLDKLVAGDISLDAATTRLPDSTSRGRAKVFSDKTLNNYGEPAPGGSTDANDFFTNQDGSSNDPLTTDY
jgi:phage gp36-like protein